MNWPVFGIGFLFAVLGYGLLVRSKKTSAAIVGVVLALVGGWFALTAINFGSHGWLLLTSSIVWFLIVAITMVKAPADGTTLIGIALAVLGVLALAQTYPVNQWEISQHFGEALDVAKRTWEKIFNSGTQ